MDFIYEARTWIGTRFKHQGRIKKSAQDAGGCDCLGFVLGLGITTKTGELLNQFDVTNYPRLIRSNILLERLDQLFEKTEIIQIGSLVLIEINNWPQHLAIVTNIKPNIQIIHAYAQAQKVVEQHLPEEWKKNIVAIYSVIPDSSTAGA